MIRHSEYAKTLTQPGGMASLATLHQGFPFASLVQFALDAVGRPLFLISDLAEHTQNLKQDSRCSLLVTQAGPEEPLTTGRVTLVGTALPSDTQEHDQEVFLRVHPGAKQYAAFRDFQMWRMEVEKVRYVGGFGQMSWVDAQEYREAEPDPVAEFAAGVIEHMNADHGDALVLMAAEKLGRNPHKVVMTYCDGAGFRVRVDDQETVTIAFGERVRTPETMRKVFVQEVQRLRG